MIPERRSHNPIVASVLRPGTWLWLRAVPVRCASTASRHCCLQTIEKTAVPPCDGCTHGNTMGTKLATNVTLLRSSQHLCLGAAAFKWPRSEAQKPSELGLKHGSDALKRHCVALRKPSQTLVVRNTTPEAGTVGLVRMLQNPY